MLDLKSGLGRTKTNEESLGAYRGAAPRHEERVSNSACPPNPGAELGKKASSNEAQKPRQSPAPRVPRYLSVSVLQNGAALAPFRAPLRYGFS